MFSIVREIYAREHDDLMKDLNVNFAVWGIFLFATLRAAVHLGQDHEANLRCMTNNLWNSVDQFFRETGKQQSLSDHQRENLRLLRLCALRGKNGYSENHHFKDMNRIDAMPTEFE